MTYKMYLMSISGLEEECLKLDAMCFLDSRRKELVYKYKKEKDRMRAIAAGLLLQAGFLELELNETLSSQYYVLESKALITYLKELVMKEPDRFPVEILYKNNEHGKPVWNKELMKKKLPEGCWLNKTLWHFNLSHSGDYVVLIVADVEVGVDIQEPRQIKSYPGGYKAFSRMEAFVKCTGEGYAKGHKTYDKYRGEVPGYEIQNMQMIDQYALNICFAVGDDCRMGQK